MPTIRDVAQRAGVAPITVSRVINNSSYVTQEKRERVEAVIASLGYVPNIDNSLFWSYYSSLRYGIDTI